MRDPGEVSTPPALKAKSKATSGGSHFGGLHFIWKNTATGGELNGMGIGAGDETDAKEG